MQGSDWDGETGVYQEELRRAHRNTSCTAMEFLQEMGFVLLGSFEGIVQFTLKM